MKEDRDKLILDKDITIQEWEEREEIIKKRDEIRKKQNNCKDCEKCNPHTPTFFSF